ncbi:MAG: TetR/AcrR family transcriptional regulator [Thiogranum sp.]|nr:TetR/AcrR family transcriptional regulator [Thiogranum sp.]
MTQLREKKFARTRLALARALSQALTDQPLPGVSVKALCHEAEVSEATFFNYFPGKQDLMGYLAQMWLLELGWHVQAAAAQSAGLPVIDALFAHTATTCARKPGVFRELLVWIARGASPGQTTEISAVEKRLAFPDLEGIDAISIKGLDALLVTPLEAAIAAGDLPANTLVPALLSALLSVLLGAPLTLLSGDPRKIGAVYRQQLNLLWAGARAAARGQ